MQRFSSFSFAIGACVLMGCAGPRAAAEPEPARAAAPPLVTVPEPEPAPEVEPAAEPPPPDERPNPLGGPPDAAPGGESPLSPPAEALGAIARRAPNGGSDRSIVLLRAKPRPDHCTIDSDHADYLMSTCRYGLGGCTSMTVSFKNGQRSGHRVKLTVLSAPSQKGARGKLRIEPGDGNVSGGELDVLVCD